MKRKCVCGGITDSKVSQIFEIKNVSPGMDYINPKQASKCACKHDGEKWEKGCCYDELNPRDKKVIEMIIQVNPSFNEQI